VGRRLYDLLVAPIRGRLAGAKHVVIVADRAIARVPFAALRDSTGRYLIEELSLTYAPRVERRSRPGVSSQVSSGDALFVGNPAWEQSLFPDLAALPSAELEVENVRSLYERPMVLNGADATRARFLRELPGRTLLHFAGHARITTDDATSSHLVLAHDSSGFASNVIFATDIARLDLRAMRLAILSACGATHDRYASSVANGLVQAFLDAGAVGVISSQWEADDEGTAELMRVLHDRLRADVVPEEALRQAQLTYLERNRERGTASNRARIWSTFRFSTD
jgi:CHAT domain-containing protein